jgi:hypothetical protein
VALIQKESAAVRGGDSIKTADEARASHDQQASTVIPENGNLRAGLSFFGIFSVLPESL